MTFTSLELKSGDVLIHRSGALAVISHRKDDGTGWWCQGGGGINDHAAASDDWMIVPPARLVALFGELTDPTNVAAPAEGPTRTAETLHLAAVTDVPTPAVITTEQADALHALLENVDIENAVVNILITPTVARWKNIADAVDNAHVVTATGRVRVSLPGPAVMFAPELLAILRAAGKTT